MPPPFRASRADAPDARHSGDPDEQTSAASARPDAARTRGPPPRWFSVGLTALCGRFAGYEDENGTALNWFTHAFAICATP